MTKSKALEAFTLLSSMVECREKHSDESRNHVIDGRLEVRSMITELKRLRAKVDRLNEAKQDALGDSTLPKDSCETCEFWKRLDPTRKDGEHVQNEHGWCRKKAPVVVTEGELAGSDGWPVRPATDWCGDHEKYTACASIKDTTAPRHKPDRAEMVAEELELFAKKIRDGRVELLLFEAGVDVVTTNEPGNIYLKKLSGDEQTYTIVFRDTTSTRHEDDSEAKGRIPAEWDHGMRKMFCDPYSETNKGEEDDKCDHLNHLRDRGEA